MHGLGSTLDRGYPQKYLPNQRINKDWEVFETFTDPVGWRWSARRLIREPAPAPLLHPWPCHWALSTSPTPTSPMIPHYKGLSPRRMCWMQLEVLQGRRRGLRLAPRLPWQLAHSSLPLSARPATANGQDTGCAPRARYRPPVLSTPEERRRVLLCIAAPFGETSLLILH